MGILIMFYRCAKRQLARHLATVLGSGAEPLDCHRVPIAVPFSSSLLCYMHMTKSLKKAIEELRVLAADEQDAAADVIFMYLCSDQRHHRLMPLAVHNTAQ
jgi:hypothetical protein